MTTSTADQIADTYRLITTDLTPNDLDRAVAEWWTEENESTFDIGCPDWPDRPALIYLVEAARSLCGLNRQRAAELLRLALTAIEEPT